MDALVGTSGYAYDMWKGDFYPDGMKSDEMLGYYAARLPTVEINNTFYRIPKREVVQRWADVVPESFRFVIKASRRITHLGRLGDVKDSLDYMLTQLEPLGERCGPVLFQCPPAMRKDVERLRRFLSWVPKSIAPAMEFRHVSWADDEVFDVLRERNSAWVVTDDEGDDPPIVATADWGFLRLRAREYAAPDRQRWAQKIKDTWPQAFVFFKHEDRATQLAFELRDAIVALHAEDD